MRGVCLAVFLSAVSLPFLHGEVAAQTALEKAARDETFKIPEGDPEMAAAMRQARASLSEFFALVQSPKPSMKSFSVKVGLPYDGGREFFWIAPFQRNGDKYVGRLNNTPRSVRNVKAGDTITFREDEIVDWTYTDDGNIKGNFTACVLLKREPRQEAEAFIKRHRLDCRL
jgi:uncharacterized protein YegJ (DUF2314 family)